MIIWSGWGALTVLFAILGITVGVALDPVLAGIAGIPQHGGLALGLLLAALLNWFVGARLNNRPARQLLDPRTGQTVILRSRHTLFWIPMQYYSVLLVILAAAAAFGALNPASIDRPTRPA